MNETKLLIHVLLVLCLFGIGLTIAADEWSGLRRWKIGTVLILIAYCSVSILR